MWGDRQRVGPPWLQYAGLAVLLVATLVICYLALARQDDATTAADQTPAGAPTGPSEPGSTGPIDPSVGATGATETGTAPAADVPKVKELRHVDFTASDRLPDGATVYDNDSNDPGLGVRDGLLSHGTPTRKQALGSLETELTGPVQLLGATVRFAGSGTSGAAVLVAWQQSFNQARGSDKPAPASGLRLVVTPGAWQLTSYDKVPKTIAEGTYDATGGGAQTFEVVRQDDQAWITDPAGTVTPVTDPGIGQLAGPWASWQLLEAAGTETPAAFESVWAG
jgi:hypothetical protein